VSRVAAGGAAAYYDFDLTGNTAGLTNTAGAYVNRYTYLPFGETTTQASALPNPFTFAGQFGVMSVGGGLFDMRARAYSPATGQFLSDDPTGLAGGDTNLRRYVANEPMTQVDPSGLAPQYNYRGGDPALDHRIRTLMDPNSNDTLGGNRGVNNGGTDQSTTQNTKHPDTVQERDEQLQGQEEKKGNDTGTTNKSEILPPPSDPEGPSDPEEPCFPPDTLVATEAGLRPIAGVESGERVWAYDFVVGDWRLSEVERRHDGNYNGAFVTIDFGQGELTATAYHPFWVLEGEGLEERPAPLEVPVSEDRGRSLPGRWVNSHDLREGDVLFLRAKEPAAVRRVRLHPHPTQTCNLCVKGLHNYAVGEGQVLVHNVIGPKPVALPRFPALPRLQALLLPQITIKLGPSGKSFGELSIDPNYLLGPAGVGPQQAVLPEQVLPYTIGFENDPAHASLAAQDVVITETLDANLDWPTFQFGDLGFGPTTVHVAGNQSFHATVDATNVA
jgi:RHS repeat-associated protein